MSDDPYSDVTAAWAAFQPVAARLAAALPGAAVHLAHGDSDIAEVSADVAPDVRVSADWTSRGASIELVAAMPPVSGPARLTAAEARAVARALLAVADAMEPQPRQVVAFWEGGADIEVDVHPIGPPTARWQCSCGRKQSGPIELMAKCLCGAPPPKLVTPAGTARPA